MKAPFKTPIFIADGMFLVGADHELVLKSEAATPEELAEIVKRVNAHDRLMALLADIDMDASETVTDRHTVYSPIIESARALYKELS